MGLNSIIGALRVDLGLDSAKFGAGLDVAQGKLGKFSTSAKASMMALAGALAAGATAFGFAAKVAIDHADALSKMSQKAGVSVEALSRLNYAAGLSDVSLDDLGGSLAKLSKAMVEAAGNPSSSAGAAFAALGVKVVDAAGHMRDTNDVFTDIADKFSQLQDGATKTSLAMAVFGKSGADLLPLLNSGRQGLADMAAEADRLGQTISTSTAQGAEQFNDNMTRLGASLQGLVNKSLPAFLPVLDSITDALTKTDPKAFAVGSSIAGIGAAAVVATPAVTALAGATKLLYGSLAAIAALPGGVLGIAGGAYLGSTTPVGAGEDALVKQLGLTKIPGPMNVNGAKADDRDDAPALGVGPSSFDFRSFFNDASKPIDDASKSIDNLRSKFGPLAADAKNGVAQVSAGFVDAGKASDDMTDKTLGGLSTIAGALSGAFKENKALAVAQAGINVAQGITKAFADGGFLGFAEGAAVAVAGAAQVANILSTDPGSAHVSSPAAATTAASAAPSQAINVTLQGGGRYSRDEVLSLIKDINSALGDGAKINVA